jgi:hypothetical protein
MVRRWVLGVALAVVASIAIGCGGTMERATPSSAVLGAWQARPLARLDEGLKSLAETRCRAATPDASGLPAVLHDQRGVGVDTVVLAGPDGRVQCQVVGDPTGKVETVTSGVIDGAVADVPGTDDITIAGMGSSSGSQTGTVSDISGRAGSAIAALRIRLDDGREITATTSNGWFYAWWPGEARAVSLEGDDPSGRRVAAATP